MKIWINLSFSKFNSILDLYAPLKQISKQKLKVRKKLWITLGLQKSVSIKNHLVTKYIKLKDVTQALTNYNFEISCTQNRFKCMSVHVGNRACKSGNVHVTNNNMIQR